MAITSPKEAGGVPNAIGNLKENRRRIREANERMREEEEGVKEEIDGILKLEKKEILELKRNLLNTLRRFDMGSGALSETTNFDEMNLEIGKLFIYYSEQIEDCDCGPLYYNQYEIILGKIKYLRDKLLLILNT